MKVGWILYLLLAVVGLWQLARYGTFAPDAPVAERAPQMRAQVITLFGASNFSRGPLAAEVQRALGDCAMVRVVARAGANSNWALSRDDAFAQGGLVVIAFTGNDSALHRGMPLRRSVDNHRLLRQRAAEAGAEVVFVTGAPAFHGLRGLMRPGATAYARAVAVDAPDAGVIDEGRLARGLPGLMPDGLHMTDDAITRHVAPVFAQALRPLVCA